MYDSSRTRTTRPRHSLAPARPGLLQRRCACGGTPGADGECAECRRRRLQRRAAGSAREPADQVPPVVHEVLRSPGQPLGAATRALMEPRFGHDFGRVRVHTDAAAAESARAVGALAYTVGSRIVFGAQRYRPHTEEGRRLLAHELAHTVQQRGATGLQPSLEIGRADDPLEREADRAGDAAVRGVPLPAPLRATAPALRRRTAPEPAPLRTDVAWLRTPRRGEGARILVERRLIPCPCRSVPDVREGVFWNPELDAFAIAYRHCRGGTTSDVYAEVESNLSSFLGGGAPPTGTARVGFEINVVGRNVGGRAVLEILGSNVSGREGVGGRAQVVFQGGRWRVFLTADFLHRLGATAGNDLSLEFGARLGPITVEAQISDLLSPTPRGTGAGCIDFLGSSRLCATVTGSADAPPAFGGELRGTFGGPEVRREECYQCLCPPPTKRFDCILDIPPVEREVTRDVEVQVPGEHRYFFRLNRATPSEESELRDRSRRSLDTVADEVARGGRVTTIAGYASPEATEAHNEGLSEERAKALSSLLGSRLPGTPLPPPTTGGELLGRRPAPAPSSRLGEVIRAEGFRAAEDLTVLLVGEEIPPAELSDQFASLFRALPEPADRLALFGLGPGDPLEPRVLRAVEEFLRRPRAGARPWEHVFRLLRVGVVRTSRPETRQVPETERTEGSVERLPEEECRALGEQAERRGLLPAIPQELRVPRRGRADRDTECTFDLRPEDRRRGCSYVATPEMRQRPQAPLRAPRLFPRTGP